MPDTMPCMAISNAEARRRYKERHPERVKAQNREASRRHYARNRDAILARQRELKYGLTTDELAALLERAGGRCEVCGEEFTDERKGTSHIDHCHDTGAVRGVLCAPCNLALGNVRDDPTKLRMLADYVESHRAGC